MRFWRILFAIALLLTGSVVAEAGEKWALLIGVGDYIDGTRMDLKGPPNDVIMLEELLLSKFDFQSDHIRKLVDTDATKQHIVTAIRDWLAKSAKAGDTVLIYYTGHGSQIPDLNGDEADGRDEVLCPADVMIGIPGNELSDDELNELFSQIEATDVTVIFDACHAGTGTRDFEFNSTPLEFRSVDLGYPEPEGGKRAFNFEGGEVDGMDMPAAGGTRAVGESSDNFTMIASCAPQETSASAVFSEGMKRIWSGVLTYNLIKELRKADEETTYEDLLAEVLRDVKRVNRRQTPQVEGNSGRKLFTNTSQGLSPRNYIRVTRVDGKQVQLKSSAYAYDTPGSIYRVLASDKGKTVGRVKITKVIGYTIDGEVLEGNVEVPSLAVEEFHASSDEKLYVRLGNFGNEKARQAMQHRLEKIDFVWIAQADTQYADVVVAGKVEGALLSADEITAWIEEGGVRGREVTSRSANKIVGALRPLLENAYAIKKLARMDNESPPFNISVWATGLPDPGEKQTKFQEMKVGDPIYFHFRSEKDAYLTLLNVGAEGSITILFPNEYMTFNRVVAGKTYTIPTPEMGFQLNLGGPAGQELVKAFATEFPLDLSSLNAQAVGGFRALEFEGGNDGYGPSVVNGLSQAIQSGFSDNMKESTRAIVLSAAPQKQAPPPGTPTDNWSTDYVIIDAR